MRVGLWVDGELLAHGALSGAAGTELHGPTVHEFFLGSLGEKLLHR